MGVLSRFVIGTWNVSGCIRESPRFKIDEFLLSRDLAFLQETHLISGISFYLPRIIDGITGGSAIRTAGGVSVLLKFRLVLRYVLRCVCEF